MLWAVPGQDERQMNTQPILPTPRQGAASCQQNHGNMLTTQSEMPQQKQKRENSFYLGVSQIEGHQEVIPTLQKTSLNSQARSSAAAVWVQEILVPLTHSTKGKKEKGWKGKKGKEEKGSLTGNIFLRVNPNYWEWVSLAQPATGQLPTPGGRNLALLPQQCDSLQCDFSLICMVQLGSTAKLLLLKHTEFFKNLRKNPNCNLYLPLKCPKYWKAFIQLCCHCWNNRGKL